MKLHVLIHAGTLVLAHVMVNVVIIVRQRAKVAVGIHATQVVSISTIIEVVC